MTRERFHYDVGTPFTACLSPLLDALGWRGSLFHVYEAMPHMTSELDLSDFMNIMANLKFGSRSMDMRLDRVDSRIAPCLFVDKREVPHVIVKSDGDRLLMFDGEKHEFVQRRASRESGTMYLFSQGDSSGVTLHQKQKGWFQKVLARFRKTFRQAALVTFFLSLMALVTPLFVMTIYDQMPFLEDGRTLTYLVIGSLVFILSDFGLRLIRSGLFGFVGARLGNIVGNEVFRRILYLPPVNTESASIGSQALRIRDFDNVREFFSGQGINALFELPFIGLLILTMVFLGGSVALVPVAAIAAFIVMALVFLPMVRRANERVSASGARKQELVMEILTKIRQIKYSGTAAMWAERYRAISVECAADGYRAAQLSSALGALTNALIMGAGVATIIVGVVNVTAGTMTMGALIASMILVWRALAPLRSGFVVMLQVERIAKSIGQVNRLMDLETENRSEAVMASSRRIKGALEFHRVSLRYSAEAQPTLLGVSFKVEPGELLVVTGHDGAGKSTLLKLAMGMYAPQAGRVTLDSAAIRQIEPIVLRRAVQYAPQTPQFFYGTIAQNLFISHLGVGMQRIREACEKAGLWDEILEMDEGFETRIGDHIMSRKPPSFWQKLNLARSLVQDGSMLFLDEALDQPGRDNRLRFTSLIEGIKGKKTIVLVTKNPEYFSLADKILWMEKGRVRRFGQAADVARELTGNNTQGTG